MSDNDPLPSDFLHRAVLSGSKNSVIKALSQGVGVDSRNAVGETALHVCAQDSSLKKLANYLLKRNAGVNLCTIAGETPLHYACFHSLTSIVKLLLKNGADPTARTKQGMLPAQMTKNAKIRKLLEDMNTRTGLLSDKKYIEDYVLRETIGIGSFGKVKLATRRRTEETFAIKIIRKDALFDNSTLGRTLWREVCIMHLLDNENLVKLTDAMEDDKKIYLVMDFARGVELLDYISQQGKIAEPVARLIFQQIVSAVEQLHYLNIVHRDLKLENIMIDIDTHRIKIFDFGLSNIITEKEGLLSTSCGSPFYTAPEMLARKEYGPSVDMWSLGIVLFALLVGRLPFDNELSNGTIFEAVMSLERRLFIPSFVSDDAADLIRSLLRKNPLERCTITNAKKHAWLRPFNPPLVFIPPSQVLNEEAIHSMECIGFEISELERNIKHSANEPDTHIYSLLSAKYRKSKEEVRLARIIFGDLSDQFTEALNLSSDGANENENESPRKKLVLKKAPTESKTSAPSTPTGPGSEQFPLSGNVKIGKKKASKKKLTRFQTLPIPKRSKIRDTVEDVFGTYELEKRRESIGYAEPKPIEKDSFDDVLRSPSQDELLKEWVRHTEKPYDMIVEEVKRASGVTPKADGTFSCFNEDKEIAYTISIQQYRGGHIVRVSHVAGLLSKFMEVSAEFVSKVTL